ncbi:hypothetical protein [Bacillus pseudomycoides]|uniref:hypothetical protein n=1 Tax=Bacillus pseudomycoides TaxID=64104 RepID=UPI000BECB238|nr:hypothetical protein [Bacillus pseudomycoides]PEE42850.1 hypothetical protein COO02_05895 [Bacillus pseudomycoides]
MNDKHKNFLQRIHNLVGVEYEVLSIYKSLKTKVTIKHNICGHIYDVSPTGFLYTGNRCPNCNNKKKSITKKLTKNEVNQIIQNLSDNQYKLTGSYINNKRRLEILHIKCGNISLISLQNFRKGVRCHNCETKKRILNRDTDGLKDEIYNKTNGNYELVGEYIDLVTPVSIKHVSCGCIYEAKPNSFLQGSSRCPECNKFKRRTTSEFKNYVYENDSDEYSVLSDYQSAKVKITMIHNLCKTIYKVTPHNYMKGHRCPKCSSSKGEKKIMNFLQENKIIFKKEFIFKDCKNKRCLRFDFAIFKGDDLAFIIEYDGEQHFKEQKGVFFGSFKRTQRNDKIKNEYCKKKGIILERIPYTEFENIDGILEAMRFQYNL